MKPVRVAILVSAVVVVSCGGSTGGSQAKGAGPGGTPTVFRVLFTPNPYHDEDPSQAPCLATTVPHVRRVNQHVDQLQWRFENDAVWRCNNFDTSTARLSFDGYPGLTIAYGTDNGTRVANVTFTADAWDEWIHYKVQIDVGGNVLVDAEDPELDIRGDSGRLPY